MIHLTVAAPLGIDSVFFSFIERLAVQNGHVCADPPAQQLDEGEPSGWIDAMRDSSQHHFVIGYRYPPSYWRLLAESSTTVCLLADPDGISRQVEWIQKNEVSGEGIRDVRSSFQAIAHALESTIEMAEWILSQTNLGSRLLPPASAFLLHSHPAFQRLESFYRMADVPIGTTCWEEFSNEAIPFLSQLKPASKTIKSEVKRQITLADATPARLHATLVLFADIPWNLGFLG